MAIEFAIVGLAFVMLLVGTFYIGFCLYAQSVLDQATVATATLFQADKNHALGDPTTNSVKSQSVCPQLQGLLDCQAINVLNYPVSDYQTGNAVTTYNPGGSKSTMVLTLQYKVSFPTWPVLAGSSSPMVISSTVPYVNEY